jgi:acetoacetyl-CoA synthetase
MPMTSSTVESLTQIWERTFRRSPIGTEENFFDLGGDERLADLLFAQIAEAYGRKLPSTTISNAPTISALSALLDSSIPSNFSPLVQLKTGSKGPPVFIVHGLEGAACFSDLANLIDTPHPIYGFQAQGMDGKGEPLSRVEDMAALYIEALNQIQACGPYLLIGYSFGGLVALEMAQLLSAQGQRTALLVLLDAYPHARHLSRYQRLRLFAQRAKAQMDQIRQLPFRQAVAYFNGKLQSRMNVAETTKQGVNDGNTHCLSITDARLRVKQMARVALENYRPRFYHGKMHLLSAATKVYFHPKNPVSVWKDLVEELEVHTVPGDHLDMVKTQIGGLAPTLTRLIEEAMP